MTALPEGIIDLSSLTRIQVETLELHLAVHNAEISIKEAVKKRNNLTISRGTHYRIVAQAKKNIRESLLTVSIAVRMGLLKVEDVEKLISSVAMIPVDVSPEKLPEVLALIRVLADRIVMC